MDLLEVRDAAHGYVEMLHRLGVDYVFSSPGSEFIPLWEHLARYNAEGKKPFYVNVRHEGTALSMAKGYYMATGRPQALLTHVLAGLLHGAMELKAAYTDQIPLLLFVGQARTHDEEVYGGTPGPHYLSFTEVGGQQRLVQPYLKWTDNPETNANILSVIQRALQIASADPKGPVVLSVSRELLFEKTTEMRLPPRASKPSPAAVDASTLDRLVGLLVDAQNPLIYTRYLGRNRGAVSSLVALAELLGAPVYETPGYMNFPTDNPLHMGVDASKHLAEADLVLSLDASGWPPWYPPGSVSKTKARTVFMDLDPLQVKYSVYTYPVDLAVAADTSVALPQIIEKLKERGVDEALARSRRERWGREHRKMRDDEARRAVAVKDRTPIDPLWLCHCINEAVDGDTLVVHETITHGRIIHRLIERNRVNPGTWYEATGPVAHTGLGQGLGVALGVKMAEPDKTVIALEGDGSFTYNPVPAAYGLSQEYGVPFLTVVFDNLSYAAMKGHARYYPDGHSVKTGTYYGVYAKPKPDYGKLVEAFGGYSETVTDPGEVEASLARALDEVRGGRAALLDVVLKEP